MQILFDELVDDYKAEYSTNTTKFKIDLKITSDDPEELTKFVKSKLEQLRTNIVAWKFEEEKISVGVGYFYCDIDFGKPDYPYWWVE